jgi:hypothetical protein
MELNRQGLYSCPACGQVQVDTNKECDACGIVFSKHLKYTPIKALLNKFLSPKEIMEIRNTEDKFSKIQHDKQSKAELIIRCQKEKLLDLASYHVRRENDKSGMELIKKLSSSLFITEEKKKISWTPSLVIFSIALFAIVVFTLILRLSI